MLHCVCVLQVGSEGVRKQHRSQAELHYSRASALFLSLGHTPCELLRTLLERVAFIQFTTSGVCVCESGSVCVCVCISVCVSLE